MSGVEDFLEALGLEARAPTAGFFEDLFLRFQRRVATETLTRAAGDPETFDADAFFAEWVEEERGLVDGERTRAFLEIARRCGFSAALVAGTRLRPWEDGGATGHSAVVATIDGRRVLADAGFPLPVLVPLDLPGRGIPTGLGSLSESTGDSGGESARVTCDARGEETVLVTLFGSLGVETTPGASAAVLARPDASEPFALRVLDDRVLFWAKGRMTILDAWSRLEYPLARGARAALAKLFALELDDVPLRGSDAAIPPSPATLSVFHASPVAAEEARSRVGRDATPLVLVTGREEIVESAGAGSRVTIRTTLADVPPEGPGEAVRKTLVFHLVSEIFALAREGRADGSGEARVEKTGA